MNRFEVYIKSLSDEDLQEAFRHIEFEDFIQMLNMCSLDVQSRIVIKLKDFIIDTILKELGKVSTEKFNEVSMIRTINKIESLLESKEIQFINQL